MHYLKVLGIRVVPSILQGLCFDPRFVVPLWSLLHQILLLLLLQGGRVIIPHSSFCTVGTSSPSKVPPNVCAVELGHLERQRLVQMYRTERRILEGQ